MEPLATWVLRCFRCCKEFEAETPPHPDMTSALENAICPHCGYTPPHQPLTDGSEPLTAIRYFAQKTPNLRETGSSHRSTKPGCRFIR